MKKLALPVCMLLLAYALGCSKNGSKSKMELLTAGYWHIVGDSISPGRDLGSGQLETDMYKTYLDCEKDDFFMFKENGSYELNNNAMKCSSSDLQKIIGTWFFSNEDTKLNLSPKTAYIGTPADILELSEAKMLLVWRSYYNDGSVNKTHYMTLIH